MIKYLALSALWLAAAHAPPVIATEVIGRMTPAEPISETRIRQLPPRQQREWLEYLAKSRKLMAADKAALVGERRGQAVPPAPAATGSGNGMPLDRAPEWYASPEARHVAANIVSFQTPAGGWGKNADRTGPVRQPGQLYVPLEHVPATDPQAVARWDYVGTIDNKATTTEIRFLARVQAQLSGPEGEPLRAAIQKGVRYLLDAQFPNGGWPQVYPLQGGYHDAVTYNDGAFALVVTTLSNVAARTGDYAFVPEAMAAEARAAGARALDLVLATQVVVDGKRTIWAQQHDALTLAPSGARNFEPAGLSSSESTGLLMLLMKQPNPSPAMSSSIRDGTAWLATRALTGFEWSPGLEGRKLVARAGAGPIWARYYDLHTFKPIFGDRDRSIHDNVNTVSVERRNGYSWFNTEPAKLELAFKRWSSGRR